MQSNLFREEEDIFESVKMSPARTYPYPRTTRRINRVKASTNEPSLANKETLRNQPLTYSEYMAMMADKGKKTKQNDGKIDDEIKC